MSNSKKSNFWAVVGTVAAAAVAIFIGAKGGGRTNSFPRSNFMDDSINNPTTNSDNRHN